MGGGPATIVETAPKRHHSLHWPRGGAPSAWCAAAVADADVGNGHGEAPFGGSLADGPAKCRRLTPVGVEDAQRPAVRAVLRGAREWLKFEYLTKVPFCRALIDTAMLSPAEREWIDGFHAGVRATLLPLVPAEGATLAAYIEAETAPL